MFGLDQILHPFTVADFLAECLGKKAIYIPGPPEKFDGLYTWKEVNTVLNNMRPSFEGLRLVHETKSLDTSELRRMGHWLSKGATLVINYVQDVDPIAEQVAASLANEMNAAVNINCYVSFPTRQGFDNHYDTHDVFILQTAGRKVWKVFEPTRRFPLDRDPSDQKKRYAKPTEGEYVTCELTPGDVLYIPRGHWHYAVSSESCIHLTVSFNNRSGIDFLQFLANEWRENDDFLRQDFPLGRIESLLGDRPDDPALSEHIARFQSRLAELVQSEGMKERLLQWVQAENPLRTKYQLPELADLDQSPLTQDVAFRVAPNQKIVARYEDSAASSQLIARGRIVGLNKVPRGVVDVMLRPGQPFTGADLMAAAPGAAWESMRSMLTDLLVSGLIVLASAEEA